MLTIWAKGGGSGVLQHTWRWLADVVTVGNCERAHERVSDEGPCVGTSLGLTIVAILLLCVWWRQRNGRVYSPNAPCIPGWPVLGNTLEMLHRRQDPYDWVRLSLLQNLLHFARACNGALSVPKLHVHALPRASQRNTLRHTVKSCRRANSNFCHSV